MADETRIESSLERRVAALVPDCPPKLVAAIRHAVFPGGARIRPRLCWAVAEASDNDAPELVEATACALELLHCASLVHDDLPCFDDSPTRRGLPSVHAVYGEALAVLAGDALIVSAFEGLALAGARTPTRIAPLIAIVGRAAGAPHGLVAGQAWESEPRVRLDAYHRAKTGSMFVAAATAGALAAGRDPAPWVRTGDCLGAAYQVADDLLDAHAASAEAAGKPTQQDTRLQRPNAVTELGSTGAVALLRRLVAEAAAAVPDCEGAVALRALVVAMAERLVPPSLRQTAA